MTDPLVEGTSVHELVVLLTERGQTVAAAESLTAGLLTATLAGVSGASAVLRGGLVVYATDLKSSLAGVDAAGLAADGPVSESTADAHADGVRRVCVGRIGVWGSPESRDPKVRTDTRWGRSSSQSRVPTGLGCRNSDCRATVGRSDAIQSVVRSRSCFDG